MRQFFEDSRIIEPLHQGPLTEHFGSYTLLLKQQGYSRSSAQAQIFLPAIALVHRQRLQLIHDPRAHLHQPMTVGCNHLPIREARNKQCPSQVTFLSEYVWCGNSD